MIKEPPSQGLIKGVGAALREEFGSDVDLYINDVPQEFQKCSFFIRMIRSGYDRLLGRRRYRRHTIAITFYPACDNCAQQDINEVADRLYSILEYIRLDGNLVRAQRLECVSMTDTELHLEADYNIFLWWYKEKAPLMMELEQAQKVKEDEENGKENGSQKD